MSELRFDEVHLPCPCGISGDAFCRNTDGSGKCFSCGKFFKRSDRSSSSSSRWIEIEDEILDNTEYKYDVINWRGVYAHTFDFYNVKFKIHPGTNQALEVGFPYPNGSVKVRHLDRKDFYSTGDAKNATLFGMNLFDPGALKTITIFEGEMDAVSGYQMLGKGTSACVSIRASSSAKTDCGKLEVWNYINSFDRIVLCLDNDDVGHKAARSIATLFDFNKVFKVDMSRYKDANEYLQNSEQDEFVKAWYGAKRFTPDNVISTFHEIEESLKESSEDMIATYPFKGLQDALYGLHRGEVVVLKGDEGIGKTETFRAMEHHILKTVPDSRIGIIHLEEDEGTTVKGLATYEDKYPYVHPEYEVEPKQIMEAFKKATGGREDRVYIYESFDVEDENQMLDTIRFLVSACGCDFIFLDHITWLATGMENEDERKKLDRISQKLKLLAKELRFCLVMISHTNDDGKTRGSRNISKVANTVVHLIRDKVSENPEERNKMQYLVEKARTGGNTGPAGFSMFDRETMMLVDGYQVFEAIDIKAPTTTKEVIRK